MALLKITAELFALKTEEPLEVVCEQIARKHGVEELVEGSTWADMIDPASMPYVVNNGTLYLVSELEVEDAEETYSTIIQDEDETTLYLDAVIDDETDISLKEVFDVGFEVFNERE